MRGPAPATVEDRHAFDTLIDARSPAEFAIDHVPGAINCPVLDNDERRIIGTIYKQQGAFEAQAGRRRDGRRQYRAPSAGQEFANRARRLEAASSIAGEADCAAVR